MTTEQHAEKIRRIFAALKLQASSRGDVLDEGDAFFSLAFKSEEELDRIAKMLGA